MQTEDLSRQIEEQGSHVRSLKAAKAEKAEVDAEVAKLLALKQQLKDMELQDENRPRGLVLKTPKGMRDFGCEQMAVRERVLTQITDCFKRHGAQAIDTPVCERKEILAGKYGEDQKLIYDLQDQGGELLSLRYDLTVPFARHVAQNKLGHIKRYQIGKVYRRDNPSIEKGRYREFYQCDFDIAGPSDDMIADSEIICVVTEILEVVGLNDFIIKLNHRALIEGMFAVCGVPDEHFKPICSAIDKLDKKSWDEVRTEMIAEKGLSESAADKIGKLVCRKWDTENPIEELMNQEKELCENPKAKKGLDDIRLLIELCQEMGLEKRLRFDLSLARGLDYYTGVIYEAILTKNDSEIGSIAGGGRYDGLVGLLLDTSNVKQQVQCVGVSIGIERIFAIIEKNSFDPKALYPTHCYVASIGKNMVKERFKLLSELWKSGLNAEHSYKRNPRILSQLQDCETWGIPIALIIGEDEVKEGKVKIRIINSREEQFVQRSDVLQTVRQILKDLNKV